MSGLEGLSSVHESMRVSIAGMSRPLQDRTRHCLVQLTKVSDLVPSIPCFSAGLLHFYMRRTGIIK
jgi:hypothetical protein